MPPLSLQLAFYRSSRSATWGFNAEMTDQGLNHIGQWAKEVVGQGGLVPAREALQCITRKPVKRILARQFTQLSEALAQLGFGIAPDPHFGLRLPHESEHVVLFKLGTPQEALEPASMQFKMVLIGLMVDLLVADPTNPLSPTSRLAVRDQIEAINGLSSHEKRRLQANMQWLMSGVATSSTPSEGPSKLTADESLMVRMAVTATVLVDGKDQAAQLTTIQEVYHEIGMNPGLAHSDIDMVTSLDEPCFVKPAEPEQGGEPIPDEVGVIPLSPERIARIKDDTDRVSGVLAKIFVSDTTDGQSRETDSEPTWLGLAEGLRPFVLDIIGRDFWSESDFTELARSHGLMAAGALELVNEWAFSQFNEPLLEVYGGYEVCRSVAEILAKEFKKEQ